jgi:hypothetical protein
MPASGTALTPSVPVPSSFAAVQFATPGELVSFAHAALFSPALSTLHAAFLCRGYLPHFLGLTSRMLTRYHPQSIAMVKGHLDQARKNQRSTKPSSRRTSAPRLSDADEDALLTFPANDGASNERTHHCFAAVVEAATGQIHTDQIGNFIVASNTGNNDIFLLYDNDSNSIFDRTGMCILGAFRTFYVQLVAAGLRPKSNALITNAQRPSNSF